MTDNDDGDGIIGIDPDRVCLPCKSGLHNECDQSFTDDLADEHECCCRGEYTTRKGLIHLTRQDYAVLDAPEKTSGESRVKAPGEVGDVTSTGRKRATIVAPIFDGMLCEWAGLKHAGGGATPIVGCAGNTLLATRAVPDEGEDGAYRGDLHHGPDKNTLNNTPGVNLFRVCSPCHNRWHALNNPTYVKPRPPASQQWLPAVPYWNHDGATIATDEERAVAEAWWLLPVDKRPAYPYTPETAPIIPGGRDE